MTATKTTKRAREQEKAEEVEKKRRSDTRECASCIVTQDSSIFDVGGLANVLTTSLSELAWEIEGEDSTRVQRNECVTQALYQLGKVDATAFEAAIHEMVKEVKAKMTTDEWLIGERKRSVKQYPEEMKKVR